MKEEMKLTESQILTLQLIEKAQEGKHSEYTPIKNIYEYKAAKITYKATYKIWRMFKLIAEDYIKTYIDLKKKNVDEVAILLEHNVIQKCIKFYLDEINLLVELLNDYSRYLSNPIYFIEAYLLSKDRYE